MGVGAADDDPPASAGRLAEKVVNLRIFEDADGKMNRSLGETGGEALVVSQFTLYADTRKGRRPSWTDAALPDVAEPAVEAFARALEAAGVRVGRGVFGAHMRVELVNDGPVTILLDGLRPGGRRAAVTMAPSCTWRSSRTTRTPRTAGCSRPKAARRRWSSTRDSRPSGSRPCSTPRRSGRWRSWPRTVTPTTSARRRPSAATELPLYIHKDDELALTDPVAWGAGFPVARRAARAGAPVSDGDVIDAAGFELSVVHTPGHTPGSVCFQTGELLFTGDLVFKGTIGRYDFPNSSEEAMRASLRRFLTLPDSLDVLPGHLERHHRRHGTRHQPVPGRPGLTPVDLSPPRGTQDFLPPESDRLLALYDAAHRAASSFGYRYVETPTFEATDLFARSSGETSDVVSKEMYTFEDRGGRSVTLRPEGTAAVVRAYLANAHDLPTPFKALLRGDALPVRPAAEGAAARVPDVRHRGARRGRSRRPTSRSSRPATCCCASCEAGGRARRASSSSSTASATRCAAPRTGSS